ncbi:MAG: hypothetical protein R2824_25520 [Saprospiraceae bacterium]|nr:hypothetical protein [Lewinella sp.]
MGLNTLIMVNNLPDPEMDLADRIEVTERMDQSVAFSIHYSVDVCGGDVSRLRESRFDPDTTITILVPEENNLMNCLVKGPVNSQQIHLEHGGAGSWMQVGGADTSIIMGREFRSDIWNSLTDSEVVMAIASRPEYRLIPDAERTNTRHLEMAHVLVQRSNDLQFVRRLARRNGFHFWVSCNPLGIETAHFKKPELNGSPVVDLVINQDGCNMQNLAIRWDTERPTTVENRQLDMSNKNSLNHGTSTQVQNVLGGRSLRQIQGLGVHSTHIAVPSDNGNISGSEAVLMEADWFINASCRTTYRQIKKVIHLYDIINVVGAGSRHSGKYMVSGVRHTIDETAHQMEIELIRNGWD